MLDAKVCSWNWNWNSTANAGFDVGLEIAICSSGEREYRVVNLVESLWHSYIVLGAIILC